MQNWIEVCDVERIAPDTGVCALVGETQVAVFRIAATNQLFAISNHDPFSGANVLSRGIVGDKNGLPKVASPVYKQNFCLQTGACLDDPEVKLPVYPVRCENGRVFVGM
jgi:nitrite reductase (NADH) small subunit